ncbi:MAG: T9SS type A sorting domain-containing protein [Bacteroidota bacterium]
MDIAVASVHCIAGVVIATNPNFPYVSNHANFLPNYSCADYGAYSSSITAQGTHCPGCDNSSALYDQLILNSQNDVGSDVIINQNGEIVVAAYTDFLWKDDAAWFQDFGGCGGGGILDCTRDPCYTKTYTNTNTGIVYRFTYEEYKDANAWLLKIGYNTGMLTANNGQNNPAHIAHMSGEDFRTQIGEDCNGNIYMIGSTADNTFCAASNDLNPPAEFADMLVCKVNPDFTRVWRKHFSSSGLNQSLNTCTTPYTYDYDCGFGLVVNSDNSVTVCGNNGENGDDAVFTKLSSDEQTEKVWNYMTGYTAPPGASTFPGGAGPVTFKGTLLVPAGATLTINGTEIQFAETKEVVDYNNPAVNILQCGIVVATGGHLILTNNALLRGLALDPLKDCSRNFMWDGITVIGNTAATQTPANQGFVEINTGAKIQDAGCGMRFDSKTWYNNQQTNVYQDAGGIYIAEWDRGHFDYPSSEGRGGGYVYAIGAKFLNNGKDAEYLPYNFNGANNVSIFNGCELKCSDVLADPARLGWDDMTGAYVRVGTDAHVTMWGVYGIKYIDCLFSGFALLPDRLRGHGIRSIDANYSVNGSYLTSRFDFLTFGINATGIVGNNALTIENSTFADNIQGIVLQGNDLSVIKNNHFFVPKNSHYEFATGIYTLNTKSFNIYGNEYWSRDIAPLSKNYAIVVKNAGILLSTIIRNKTHDFRIATQYETLNTKLDIQCNEFYASLTDWAIVSGSVNKQGVCLTYKPVNNIFTPAGPCTGIVNIDATLGAPFLYDSWDLCPFPPNCVTPTVTVATCISSNGADPCLLVPAPRDKVALKSELQQLDNQLAVDPENEALIEASKKDAVELTPIYLKDDNVDSAAITIRDYMLEDTTALLLPLEANDSTANTSSQIIAAANDTSLGNEATLYTAILAMNDNNHDYFTLSSAEINSFATIATGTDVAAVKAQQILDWNKGEARLRKPLDLTSSGQRTAKQPKENQVAPSFTCMPNPFSDQLTIKYHLPEITSNVQVQFINPASGAIEKSISLNSNDHEYIVNCSDMPSGVHIVKMFTDQQQVGIKKVVLIK